VQNQRNSFVIVTGLAAALLCGCQNDEIRSYRVPRSEPTRPSAPPGATRLLAVIIPHGAQTWFFKLLGPVVRVDEQKQVFDQFIRSVRFNDQAERPVTWTVPEGWRAGPAAQPRYATFYLGSQEPPLELTVFNFSGPTGSVLGNINRWRGQIGLGEIRESELGQISTKVQLECGPATLVDMTSHGETKAATMPGPDILSRRAGAGERLKYDIPEGWKEIPDPKRLRQAVFVVADGAAEAGIMTAGGGLLMNVNRWRNQLHLDPIDQKQLGREVRQLQVAGSAASYVDFTGPESAGQPRQRMLGVVLPRAGETWFFTLKGPADVVDKQKTAFEAFVKSMRFEAGS
jgi:hypothetical protein